MIRPDKQGGKVRIKMLTKKDFKAIAEIIAKQFVDDSGNNESWIIKRHIRKTAQQLADYFAIQNPRFDRRKFLDACGL